MVTPSLREVRIFAAVYEEQSFTGAAHREHATQSGVSQHINNLEGRLGVKLFTRGKGLGVTPTPAANAYYLRCIEILKAHSLFSGTLDQFTTGLAGEIVLGLMPTMTRCQLPPAVLAFTSENPNVSVRVVEAYSQALTEKVRSGELDFAIVPGTRRVLTGIKETLFLRTRECLVSSLDSPHVHMQPVGPADLSGIKLVVPGPINARREVLEKYMAVHGVEVSRRLELDAMLGTLGLVRTSDWQAILPALLMASDIAGQQREFTVNPLEGPSMVLDLMLIEPLRQPLSVAALAFLDALRKVAEPDNLVSIDVTAVPTVSAKPAGSRARPNKAPP